MNRLRRLGRMILSHATGFFMGCAWIGFLVGMGMLR
jgi:hypothetical protein